MFKGDFVIYTNPDNGKQYNVEIISFFEYDGEFLAEVIFEGDNQTLNVECRNLSER